MSQARGRGSRPSPYQSASGPGGRHLGNGTETAGRGRGTSTKSERGGLRTSGGRGANGTRQIEGSTHTGESCADRSRLEDQHFHRWDNGILDQKHAVLQNQTLRCESASRWEVPPPLLQLPTHENDGGDDELSAQLGDAIADLDFLHEQSSSWTPNDTPSSSYKVDIQGNSGNISTKEQSSEMTKAILKKLYRKNVQLEKENQLLKVQLGPGGTTPGPGTSDLALTALQERDRTIVHMETQLAAVQARCSALEKMLTLQRDGRSDSDAGGVGEAVAVSRAAMDQYRRIRQDYHQLLGRRAQGVVRTASANTHAKKVGPPRASPRGGTR